MTLLRGQELSCRRQIAALALLHRENRLERLSQLRGDLDLASSRWFAASAKIVASVIANVPMMSFLRLREIHRASECTLQGLLRPISSRGEANLVSPRGFQKGNTLIICVLAKISSRGEIHEAAWRRSFTSCTVKLLHFATSSTGRFSLSILRQNEVQKVNQQRLVTLVSVYGLEAVDHTFRLRYTCLRDGFMFRKNKGLKMSRPQGCG